MRQVDRGVAMLDGKKSGWATRISLEKLDIASTNDCVVSQLYGGSWPQGLKRLGLSLNDARRLGFWFYTPLGYFRANQAWREIVAVRQKATQEKASFWTQVDQWRAETEHTSTRLHSV